MKKTKVIIILILVFILAGVISLGVLARENEPTEERNVRARFLDRPISEEQRDQIRKHQEQKREFVQGLTEEQKQAMHQVFREAMEQAVQRIKDEKILTDEQLEQWQNLRSMRRERMESRPVRPSRILP